MPALSSRSSVCLNMIVKNESAIIARCLSALRHLISRWVIVDTGSRDGTQSIVCRELAGIPGELHERPWRNFGENRTEALRLASGKADYTLVIDADEELLARPDFDWPALTLDSYQIKTELVNLFYYRTQLLRNSLDWHFEGVLHEYPACEAARTEGCIQGLVNRPRTDGARSKDPDKYDKDAAILEEALLCDPQNRRYKFYLAQSYRDAGHLPKAVTAYSERVTMGGWEEEIWYSLFQLARLSELLREPEESVVAAYRRAFEYRRTRAECLCELARYYRRRKKFALAFEAAAAASRIPQPADILFVDASAYEWRSLDEYAIAGFYLGNYGEAWAANRELLASGTLPPAERSRIERNASLCLEHLGPESRSPHGAPRSGASSRTSARKDSRTSSRKDSTKDSRRKKRSDRRRQAPARTR